MKKPNKNAAGRQRAQRGGHSWVIVLTTPIRLTATYGSTAH